MTLQRRACVRSHIHGSARRILLGSALPARTMKSTTKLAIVLCISCSFFVTEIASESRLERAPWVSYR